MPMIMKVNFDSHSRVGGPGSCDRSCDGSCNGSANARAMARATVRATARVMARATLKSRKSAKFSRKSELAKLEKVRFTEGLRGDAIFGVRRWIIGCRK